MDPLPDPCNDRKLEKQKAPPHKPLSKKLLYPDPKNPKKPDWKALKDHLHREGKLAKEDLVGLINEGNKIIKNEGNLLYLYDPLTVVGDIHGQYYDMMKILDVGGAPENTKYLFLGDFVDRGSFSIEVMLLLYALKINFPKTIHFIRGNHECRQMTSFFNFRTECAYKYDQDIYELFMDSFDNIPLSCVVNGRFLAVHGGISPDLKNIEDINKIDRFKEPPKQGLFCDLLWSDPVDNDEGICEHNYKFNEVRGCSYFYGADAATRFLEKNNLLTIIRAHEAQIEGFKMHKWSGADFPLVITIFSAPNYCDIYNNKGAVIKFDNNTLNIQQFNYSPHPYLLPNFMDVFTWSIPFVAEKVVEMFYHIIKNEDGLQDSDDDDDSAPVDIKDIPPVDGVVQKKGGILKNKIKFVSKLLKMQKLLRQKSEDIIEIKKSSKSGTLPFGILLEGNEAIEQFVDAKKTDVQNERRPG